MNSTRIKWFAACLTLVCLILTGNALAGTTTATEVTYAREVGAANAVYDLPTGNTVARLMNVLRGTGANFFVDVTLSDGALWDASGPPVGFELTFTSIAPAFYTATLLGTPAGTSTATYFVAVTNGIPATFPTGTFTSTGFAITDVNNVLGTGGTVSITMATRDSGTGNPFDSGTDTDDWLKSAFGVDVLSTLNPTTAEFEFTTFGDTPPDTTFGDNGATIGIDSSVPGPLTLGGAAYTLVAADTVELVMVGDLSGITSITWDPGGVVIVDTVTAGEVTAGTTTLTIPGDRAPRWMGRRQALASESTALRPLRSEHLRLL